MTEASAAEPIAAPLDYRNNPFTLVYENAITRNEPGQVNIHPVNYDLNGLKIVANVYTPANHDPKKKYAAIVVAHPNGGVKEQTAGLHAQRLSELGYITIAMDAAYQGGSGGGGYALAAAKSDKRFKSIATLSMFNTGRVRRNGFADSQLETIQQRLKQASDARAQEKAGGKIPYSGDADMTDAQIAALPFEMYRQGYEYYWRTHAHPNSTFKYTTSSLMDLMRWDATDEIELIHQPLLMIAGSKADSLYMSEEALPKATGTKDKELFKIDGATHIETYWVPKYVDATMGKLKAFYARTL